MQVIICITGSHPWNVPGAFSNSMIPMWARVIYYMFSLKQGFPRYYRHLKLYNIFLKSCPQINNPNTPINMQRKLRIKITALSLNASVETL